MTSDQPTDAIEPKPERVVIDGSPIQIEPDNYTSTDEVDEETKKDEEPRDSFINRLKLKLNSKEPQPDMVSFYTLFRFAEPLDYFFMIVGTVFALANGALIPILIVVWNDVLSSFVTFETSCGSSLTNGSMTNDNATVFVKLTDLIKDQTIYFIVLGICTNIASYFQVAFWIMAAERQTNRLRNKLFTSILRQNIGWYDVYKTGELTNRLTDDVAKIKEGISDKFANAIQFISTFLVSIIISLVKGWKLTLVILSVSPLLLIGSIAFTVLAGMLTSNELKSYAKAGSIADEVLTTIRTVLAFNGAKKELARYESKLDAAKVYGIRKGFFAGLLMGYIWFIIYAMYALGFWYGWRLYVESTDGFGVGQILTVFFLVLIGVFSLGNGMPYISTAASARAAAFEVFKIIDRVPPIDSTSETGDKIDLLAGRIQLDNIHFNYPSRPEVPILQRVKVDIKAASTVAFVGHSGCGKSTCIQLIQRFYDPDTGSVLIDGKNVKGLNLNWWRSQIGIVSQEPVLFGTTIKENIKFGKTDATDEEVVKAAKDANAHNFIMKLPDNYDTQVGDRGGQLSGGQKQRIAIARALIRNPRILLLDEATSALDNESEAIVQAALEKASEGRTTIIIAHRLSTVREADVIFAFEHGQIVEYGTHSELMGKQSVYYNLVINQQNAVEKDVKKKHGEGKVRENDDIILVPEKHEETEADQKDKKNKNKDGKNKYSIKDLFMVNKPEWFYILLGCFGSLVTGSMGPAYGLILSKITAVFSLCKNDPEQANKVSLYCVLFVVLGIITFFSNIIMSGMFAISGENLTKRMRTRAFKSMLSQDIGWFDAKENNVGTLTTKLAVEASAVQGATGIRLGFFLQLFGYLGIGIVIAFVYSWAITLLILAFLPLMIIGNVFQVKLMTGLTSKDQSILEEAGRVSNEAIGNIRTVVMLNKEPYFIKRYYDTNFGPYLASMKSAHAIGFGLGFSTSILFYAMAAVYNVGAHLVENKIFGTQIEDIFIVMNVILIGASQIGQAGAFMPDYAKAKASVNSMFELFERVPPINNWDEGKGARIEQDEYDGKIVLSNVGFTYPSRPEAKILDGFNIAIEKGQRVALVGSSGCGKSTITQLLERFYDADEGTVTLSNRNLKDLDIYWLRSQIGIVQQEPILFDLSIAENIAYGDNSRTVPMEEIVQAAKKANIHNFILNLPKGYETNVGLKGTQLSGGQKQRIAIARSLVRDPKILLLDEATSALDTESEKVVQDALEKAQEGRTSIIIAHRLSTIRTCDVIFVVQNGKILEKGNHAELMALNGFYAKLNSQS